MAETIEARSARHTMVRVGVVAYLAAISMMLPVVVTPFGVYVR